MVNILQRFLKAASFLSSILFQKAKSETSRQVDSPELAQSDGARLQGASQDQKRQVKPSQIKKIISVELRFRSHFIQKGPQGH